MGIEHLGFLVDHGMQLIHQAWHLADPQREFNAHQARLILVIAHIQVKERNWQAAGRFPGIAGNCLKNG